MTDANNRGRTLAIIGVVAYIVIRYVTSPPAPGKLQGHVLATVGACAMTWFLWWLTTPKTKL